MISPVSRLADRWRSVPAAAALMAFVLLIAGLGLIYQNERSYQAQKVRETEVQAEILAASSMAALDFGDPIAAQESADALRVNPQVRTAAIYDRGGRLFAGFSRNDETIPAILREPDPADAAILINVPVVSGGEQVGTAQLVTTREPLSRRLTRYSLIALFVILAALVAVVLGVAHSVLRRANRELESRAHALVETNLELQVQIDERAKAEEQLRQAQKMQALGQLTGGIAHDFNNLLTVIQGSADILQRPNLTEEKRTRFAAAISQTAGRAAALTAQLLAFARRQPLRPETLDLNEQIVGMVELLDRTLGERILVKTELSPHVCTVKVDPVQLESAVLNIAVNARDAMPDGGTLTLRTAPVDGRPDDDPAIALSISDTGAGIDEEALSRVFEPFFTTKDVGKGTGLGLSQVYGFATQSGGDVKIDSIVGEGTTVTLILPCSDQGIAETIDAGLSAKKPTTRVCRIMVVDDNEEVGAFAEALLEELGHRVVRATSGEEALSLFGRFPVDAVFTDVVMPGMDGIALAGKLRERDPAMPIILTTGFSDQISGAAAKDLPVLFKPYKLEALAEMLESVMAKAGSLSQTPLKDTA